MLTYFHVLDQNNEVDNSREPQPQRSAGKKKEEEERTVEI